MARLVRGISGKPFVGSGRYRIEGASRSGRVDRLVIAIYPSTVPHGTYTSRGSVFLHTKPLGELQLRLNFGVRHRLGGI